MLFEIAVLITSLGVILVCAGFFTNGIEWFGRKLCLNKGTIGSVLAAVGTAMPETIIPLIAILLAGGEVGHAIGIGAILGAPFMLGTLAIFLSGGAVLVFQKSREGCSRIIPEKSVILRDLLFFLVVYTLAVLAAFLPAALKYLVAAGLVLAYAVFVYKTVTGEEGPAEECAQEPLLVARKLANPPLFLVVAQVVLSLGGIIVGAKFFVDGITRLSSLLGVPAFIFSLIIAPLATEMPEKFNSIIWLRQNKDTLALGNITGAMVFQSSVIPAIGIVLTPWILTEAALFSALLALLSSLATYIFLRRFGYLDARLLVTYGGVFYVVFLAAVFSGIIA